MINYLHICSNMQPKIKGKFECQEDKHFKTQPVGGLGDAFFATAPGWFLKCIPFWQKNLRYVLNYYASHVFHGVSKKYFSKTNKTFRAFYYDRPLGLIWTKFDNELLGYVVYAKKVPFPLFQIIVQNVKERIQIKFELTWTLNRTACWMHTQIWQHSINGNQ